MDRDEQDSVRRAILLSLVLHALALYLLPAWQAPRWPASALPVNARLVTHEFPDAEVQREALAEKADPEPARESIPQQAVRKQLSPVKPVRSPRAVPDEVKAAPVASGVASSETPANVESDGGTLSHYRVAVMLKARALKRYPRIAVENGWQGRVALTLRIDEAGAVESVSVTGGSGYPVLDGAAAETAALAAEQVPVPASLRGRAFAADLLAIFSL